jgi:hypothetical protein
VAAAEGGLNELPRPHPYSIDRVLQNQLSNLVPLRRTNQQCYQLGFKHPQGDLDGYGPMWEVISMVLGPFGTKQARVNLQRDFHLLGVIGNSSTANGFRMQLYDVKKRRRFADRPFGHTNLLGGQGSVFMLRRPYRFDEPNSQVLVMMQNFDNVTGTEQVVLYGCVLRFNDPRPWRYGRHGHQYMRRFLDPNLGPPWYARSEEHHLSTEEEKA